MPSSNSARAFALVMAGGQGIRLWPKSTAKFPKQYLSLTGGRSLVQNTIHRLSGVFPPQQLYVMTTEEQKSLAAKAHPQLIVEPMGRNTAPAIYLALIKLRAQGCEKHDLLGVFPSDHHIEPTEELQKTLRAALALASKRAEQLVLVGVSPHSPHTGYGYIERGEGESVASFTEKPDQQTVQNYLEQASHLWNTGMFLGTWNAFYQHYVQFCPQYVALTNPEAHYQQLAATSFDYAILEHSRQLLFVQGQFSWSDVGDWQSVENIFRTSPDPHNAGGNLALGATQTTSIDSQGNIVWDDEDHVALLGVSNLVVIRHQGRLLVMDKRRAQETKQLNQALGANEAYRHLL